MKLYVLLCLLCALPIVCMDTGGQEQTTTEFSKECLDKCGPGFALGGILGVGLGGICIGVPVAVTMGVTTPVLFSIALGCGAAGSAYGSLLAIACCLKPGTPIRITKQLSNTTQSELNDNQQDNG